jgi:hypothetical protein
MPISLQARWTRSAISPRLAMRTLSNIAGSRYSMMTSGSPNSTGCCVGYQNVRDLAGARRRDRVERLHRLDEQQRLALR